MLGQDSCTDGPCEPKRDLGCGRSPPTLPPPSAPSLDTQVQASVPEEQGDEGDCLQQTRQVPGSSQSACDVNIMAPILWIKAKSSMTPSVPQIALPCWWQSRACIRAGAGGPASTQQPLFQMVLAAQLPQMRQPGVNGTDLVTQLQPSSCPKGPHLPLIPRLPLGSLHARIGEQVIWMAL